MTEFEASLNGIEQSKPLSKTVEQKQKVKNDSYRTEKLESEEEDEEEKQAFIAQQKKQKQTKKENSNYLSISKAIKASYNAPKLASLKKINMDFINVIKKTAKAPRIRGIENYMDLTSTKAYETYIKETQKIIKECRNKYADPIQIEEKMKEVLKNFFNNILHNKDAEKYLATFYQITELSGNLKTQLSKIVSTTENRPQLAIFRNEIERLGKLVDKKEEAYVSFKNSKHPTIAPPVTQNPEIKKPSN